MELYTMLMKVTENNDANNKAAFSVEEVAKQTSLSKPFLRLEIRRGRLKAKRFGRRVLILKDDLEAYLENGSNGGKDS
jgi:excisionase family DNA binding protein